MPRFCRAPLQRGKKRERGRPEEKRKGHPDAIGVQPIRRGPPNALRQWHPSIHLKDRVERDRAYRFHVCPRALPVTQSRGWWMELTLALPERTELRFWIEIRATLFAPSGG